MESLLDIRPGREPFAEKAEGSFGYQVSSEKVWDALHSLPCIQ
jgi:hypothetical protein